MKPGFTSLNIQSEAEWALKVASLETEVEQLKNRLAWFMKHTFGPRRENMPVDDSLMSLFPAPPVPEKLAPAPKPVANPGVAPKSKTPRRQCWPANLERVVETHLPADTELNCSCCGLRKEKIGEDTTEILERKSVQHFVRSIVRPKFACTKCPEAGVTQQKAISRFIEKGNIGDTVVRQVVIDKYLNHMPLTRQSKNYARQGIDLPVSTTVGWIETFALRFEPVYHSLLDRIRRGAIAYSDDTSIPVMTEDKKHATHRGTMWLYGNGKDAVYFEYSPSRGQALPKSALDGFRGYLHSDAYAGYNAVHNAGKVLPVYCWAHARRKFLTALESGDETARRSLTLIGRMFLVERYLKSQYFTSLERTGIRQRVSGQIIAALEEHWRVVGLSVAPKSRMGEALGYVLSRLAGFKSYLRSGRLAIDNNLSERNLRRIVIGRKNFMFCGSNEGAKRAAIIYSLVGTCEQVGLDPEKYFTYAMDQLVNVPEISTRQLLPHRVARILAA
jgi:transposase